MSDDSRRNSDSEGLYSSKSSVSSDTAVTSSPENTLGTRPHRSSDSSSRDLHLNRNPSFRDYTLVRQIGSGDIGRVFLCRRRGEADEGQLYAMKVVDNDVLALKKKTERVETERKIMRLLDHPFLPTLFAEFEASNFSCVVMEFCAGGDLHSLRHKQPQKRFSVASARFYAAEVLVALEYLHMLGIIYRDLKPENVLLRSDGHIMLTDFDLSLCSQSITAVESASPNFSGDHRCIPSLGFRSKRIRTLAANLRFVAEPISARSSSFVGTHEYVAPEVALGGSHGNAVDWWALGIFIYELIYGRTPFAGEQNEETLRNIVNEQLSFPSEGQCGSLEGHARDLIGGLLNKDPNRRLGSKRGAPEVKTHRFFKDLNFALIRSVAPPGSAGIRRQKTAPSRTGAFNVF